MKQLFTLTLILSCIWSQAEAGTQQSFTASASVAENLQFDISLKRAKADYSCCDSADITKIDFDLQDNGSGELTAVPVHVFIGVNTQQLPYNVQYEATDLTTAGGITLEDGILNTALASATNGGSDITGLPGASTMSQRAFSTNGSKVLIFGSPDAGTTASLEVVIGVTGTDSNGDLTFSGGVVPDGNTPAGTYTGQVTYSAVLR